MFYIVLLNLVHCYRLALHCGGYGVLSCAPFDGDVMMIGAVCPYGSALALGLARRLGRSRVLSLVVL